MRWTSLGSASLQSNFMADAVIGSLPRGLSLNERDKIFASTPLSPTLSMLSSMPSVSNIHACYPCSLSTLHVQSTLFNANKQYDGLKCVVLKPVAEQQWCRPCFRLHRTPAAVTFVKVSMLCYLRRKKLAAGHWKDAD